MMHQTVDKQQQRKEKKRKKMKARRLMFPFIIAIKGT
jgi:hypothetical protein